MKTTSGTRVVYFVSHLSLSMTFFRSFLSEICRRLENAAKHCLTEKKKTSKRFVKFTEQEIASFTEDQEDANTKEKTVSDLKLFNEFLNSEDEERNIENIPAAELQQLACKQASSTPPHPKENVLNAHTKVEEALCNAVGS